MSANLGTTRVFGQTGRGVRRIGLRRHPLKDVYHGLVTGSWARLLLVYGAVYFAVEALFGAAHVLLPAPGAEGSPLGYVLSRIPGGPVAARPLPSALEVAGWLVFGVEGFLRWLLLAVGSGIIFAKFSLVKARVLFSRVAVVAPLDGGLALMFRMANERSSHVVDAKVNAMLVWEERGEDGEPIRRAHDLPLQRDGSALFSHAWTAIHLIDRQSPLQDATPAALEAAEADVIVTLQGYDEGLTRFLYARHVYRAERIRWDCRFQGIVKLLPDGTRAVDYRKFHDTVPVDPDRRPERTHRRARSG
jgi:inward rectifier potassium channel